MNELKYLHFQPVFFSTKDMSLRFFLNDKEVLFEQALF